MAEKIRRDFPAELIELCSAFGSNTEAPIFILGMPRTGSTLIEQMLGAHPNVSPMGERYDLRHVENLLIKKAETSGQTLQEQFKTPKVVQFLANEYLTRLKADGATGLRFTDKMPLNSKRIVLISILFPRSTVIHCQRDPRDVGLSIYKRQFNNELPYTMNLEAIAHRILETDAVMAYGREVLGDRLLTVRYEDLVKDFDGESRRIVRHTGLPWDDACLEYSTLNRGIVTHSQQQVRQPIYTSSVGIWRKYETQLQPLIAALEREGAL